MKKQIFIIMLFALGAKQSTAQNESKHHFDNQTGLIYLNAQGAATNTGFLDGIGSMTINYLAFDGSGIGFTAYASRAFFEEKLSTGEKQTTWFTQSIVGMYYLAAERRKGVYFAILGGKESNRGPEGWHVQGKMLTYLGPYSATIKTEYGTMYSPCYMAELKYHFDNGINLGGKFEKWQGTGLTFGYSTPEDKSNYFGGLDLSISFLYDTDMSHMDSEIRSQVAIGWSIRN